MQMIKQICLALIALATLSTSCGDEEERFEVINKLRGIGSAMTPSITVASSDQATQVIAIKFYIAVPKGQSIQELTSYDDLGGTSVFTTPLTIDGSTITTEDLGAIDMVSFDASAVVPFIPDRVIEQLNGVAKIRFGVRVKTNAEEELMVGDFIVVKAGDPALEWRKPTLTLISPSENQISGNEFSIEASITKFQEETVKVTWFVTGGQVKNPNAKKTTWSEVPAGPQSLIMVATGGRSKASSFVYRPITVAP